MSAFFLPPFSWRRDFLSEVGSTLRRATIPAFVLVGTLAAALPGVQLGNFLANNGQIDRVGAYLTTSGLRWLAPVGAVLALAVAAGGPLTARLADSGAHDAEPREHPDLEDSGQLVAAQVTASAAAAAVLFLIVLPVGIGAGLTVAALVFDVPVGVVTASLFDTARSGDVLQGLARALISGALVALVCCYYGLEAAAIRRGGQVDEGTIEGRAVGKALVAALVVVVFVNAVLAAYLLAAFPDIRFTR